MAEENQYGPDVYKRLELVKKQFQNAEAEKKKQQAAERRQRISNLIKQNKDYITRGAVYIVLLALVFSVIWVLVIR